MAKITRQSGNVKAVGSEALGQERTLFGSETQDDSLTANFNNDLLRGWGIIPPGGKPPVQWFNAIHYAISQQIAYLFQQGIPEYDAAQEFHQESLTKHNGNIYISKVGDNVGNTPSTSPADWELLIKDASTTIKGIVELATNAETQAGSDNQRAVTPAGLNSRGATTSRTGLIELATQAEVDAGSDAIRAMTPATFSAFMQSFYKYATQTEAEAGSSTGRVMSPARVFQAFQQFGLGKPNSVVNTTNANNLQLGSFIQIAGFADDLSAINYPDLGITPTDPVSFNVITWGLSTRATQIAVENCGQGGKPKGRMFVRVNHDGWQSWQEIFTTGYESVLLAKDYRSAQIGAGITLEAHQKYHIATNNTYTLPAVSGLTGGDTVVMTKSVFNTPTIQVHGGGGEKIRVGKPDGTTVADTSITFDINSEIIFVWNGTSWEV